MVADEFIRRRTVDLTLRDGTLIRVRPICPEDKGLLSAENSPMRHLLSDEGIDLQFDADAGALRGTGPIPVADELHSDLGNQFLAALGEWNRVGANPDEL
jgi:hypothetical protein